MIDNFPLPEKKRLIKFYEKQLKDHGPNSHESLHWSDLNAQQRRFEILVQIADLNGKTILDLGCGLGDLFGFLSYKGIKCDYLGVDLVPDLIEAAQNKFPDGKFRVADIEDFSENEFDYVLASGIFSFKIDNYKKVYFSKIKEMYNVAKEGVAFNMLNKEYHIDNNLFAAYSKEEVEEFCHRISSRIKLVDNYLFQDFTLYLYK